ncbi:hypothetical protein [Pantoea sp. S18]|uniref:hypothetical protein n=1 Tax=Pantoea sp. S18 TaxID=3019892 RepID=UPI002B20DD76|nr:hypothetical protein [Pantoea sp. S18]MEA5103108.1 hypothetical protein [Pantoea sp. S18]
MGCRKTVIIYLFSPLIYSNFAIAEIDVIKSSELIKEMATTICGEMIYDGNKHSEKLTVDATAKVNSILKKVADIGGTVKVDLSNNGYYGVLQEQLGSTIKNNQECRMHIWDDMKVMFVDKPVILPSLPQPIMDNDVVGDCNQVVTGSSSVSLKSSCTAH